MEKTQSKPNRTMTEKEQPQEKEEAELGLNMEPIPISHQRGQEENEKNENHSGILKQLQDFPTPLKSKQTQNIPYLPQINPISNSNRSSMNGAQSKQNNQSNKHYLTPLNLPLASNPIQNSRYNKQKCVITYNFDVTDGKDQIGQNINGILTHNIFLGWDDQDMQPKKKNKKINKGINGKDYIHINKSVCKTIRNTKSICKIKRKPNQCVNMHTQQTHQIVNSKFYEEMSQRPNCICSRALKKKEENLGNQEKMQRNNCQKSFFTRNNRQSTQKNQPKYNSVCQSKFSPNKTKKKWQKSEIQHPIKGDTQSYNKIHIPSFQSPQQLSNHLQLEEQNTKRISKQPQNKKGLNHNRKNRQQQPLIAKYQKAKKGKNSDHQKADNNNKLSFFENKIHEQNSQQNNITSLKSYSNGRTIQKAPAELRMNKILNDNKSKENNKAKINTIQRSDNGEDISYGVDTMRLIQQLEKMQENQEKPNKEVDVSFLEADIARMDKGHKKSHSINGNRNCINENNRIVENDNKKEKKDPIEHLRRKKSKQQGIQVEQNSLASHMDRESKKMSITAEKKFERKEKISTETKGIINKKQDRNSQSKSINSSIKQSNNNASVNKENKKVIGQKSKEKIMKENKNSQNTMKKVEKQEINKNFHKKTNEKEQGHHKIDKISQIRDENMRKYQQKQENKSRNSSKDNSKEIFSGKNIRNNDRQVKNQINKNSISIDKKRDSTVHNKNNNQANAIKDSIKNPKNKQDTIDGNKNINNSNNKANLKGINVSNANINTKNITKKGSMNKDNSNKKIACDQNRQQTKKQSIGQKQTSNIDNNRQNSLMNEQGTPSMLQQESQKNDKKEEQRHKEEVVLEDNSSIQDKKKMNEKSIEKNNTGNQNKNEEKQMKFAKKNDRNNEQSTKNRNNDKEIGQNNEQMKKDKLQNTKTGEKRQNTSQEPNKSNQKQNRQENILVNVEDNQKNNESPQPIDNRYLHQEKNNQNQGQELTKIDKNQGKQQLGKQKCQQQQQQSLNKKGHLIEDKVISEKAERKQQQQNSNIERKYREESEKNLSKYQAQQKNLQEKQKKKEKNTEQEEKPKENNVKQQQKVNKQHKQKQEQGSNSVASTVNKNEEKFQKNEGTSKQKKISQGNKSTKNQNKDKKMLSKGNTSLQYIQKTSNNSENDKKQTIMNNKQSRNNPKHQQQQQGDKNSIKMIGDIGNSQKQQKRQKNDKMTKYEKKGQKIRQNSGQNGKNIEQNTRISKNIEQNKTQHLQKEENTTKKNKKNKKQHNDSQNSIQYANITCSPQLLHPISQQQSSDNNYQQPKHKKNKNKNNNSKSSHNKTEILPHQPTVYQRKLNKNNIIHKNRYLQNTREEYQRAPILSYIYGEHQKDIISNHHILDTERQKCMIEVDQDFTSVVKMAGKVNIVDRVIGILISIDPWLINRIFQPYMIDGQTQAWLYCKGEWKMYRSEECISISSFLEDILIQAITEHYANSKLEEIGIEQLLRMVTGLRVMQLKNKKKLLLSDQIIYNLKRGYIIKGISSPDNKNKKNSNKTYEILDVKNVEDEQRLIQVKVDDILERRMEQDDDEQDHYEDQSEIGDKGREKERDSIMWIKQSNLPKYFDYFLLICYREQSMWTTKFIENGVNRGEKENQKKSYTHVYTLDSLHAQSSLGSIEIHQHPVSSEEGLHCHIDLYRQIKPKVLKFIGKIDEKYKPIRSKQNPNPTVYFDFSIKGRYYLFITIKSIQTEQNKIYLSLQSSQKVDINFLQKIENKSRKNDTSEYIEYKNQSKSNSKIFQNTGSSFKASNVKEQFIDYLIGKTKLPLKEAAQE